MAKCSSSFYSLVIVFILALSPTASWALDIDPGQAGPTHKECVEDSDGVDCKPVPGAGPDQCTALHNCEGYQYKCSPDKKCKFEEVGGSGLIDECSEDAECQNQATVAKCAGDGICVEVPGTGESECTPPEGDAAFKPVDECQITTCDKNWSWVLDTPLCKPEFKRDPTGNLDKCEEDTSCGVNVCSKTAGCVLVPLSEVNEDSVHCGGEGQDPEICLKSKVCLGEFALCKKGFLPENTPDECDNVGGEDPKCGKTYKYCSGTTCSVYDYPVEGKKSCTVNDDCSYKVCENTFCTAKEGEAPEGAPICNANDECGHLACEGIFCVRKDGPKPPGSTGCSHDEDCGGVRRCAVLTYDPPPPDGPAQEGLCVTLSPEEAGSGPPCIGDFQCEHRECRIVTPGGPELCVSVPGAGQHQCEADHSGCKSHKDCKNGKCELVPGAGSPKCQDNYQCGHLKCRDHTCSFVPGVGLNEDGCYSEGFPCGWQVTPSSKQKSIGIIAPNSAKSAVSSKTEAISATNDQAKARTLLDGSALSGPVVTMGSEKASVALDVFVDLDCGMCKVFFRDTFPKLKKEFVDTGKLKIRIRDFPLDSKGSKAALAGRCAQENGKYLEFISAQAQKGSVAVESLSKATGLSVADSQGCISRSKDSAKVQESVALGKKLGVNGTPISFLNGVKLEGARPAEEFAIRINQLLVSSKAGESAKAKSTKVNSGESDWQAGKSGVASK